MRTGRSTKHLRRQLTLVVLLAVGTSTTGCGRSEIERNEQAALEDVMLFARANYYFSLSIAGGFVAPELLADPERVGPARALPERFREGARNGYRFRFEGLESEFQEKRPFMIEPAYPEFSYIATPLEPGKTGIQSIAYFSYRTGAVFVRADGAEPTIKDTLIEFKMGR